MTFADDQGHGRQRGGTGGQRPHPDSLPVPIFLPFPPSVNRIWRNTNGGTLKAKAYRTWLVDAGWILLSQNPDKHTGPVSIDMAFTMPDKRRRDIDNLPKPVNDLLVEHQVIQRDDWAYVRELTVRVVEADKPGVSVTITPLEGA